MKKVMALVLAIAMFLSLASFASAEGFSGEIKIWVADATVDFTKEQVEAFMAANPEYANMTVVIEPVGEGDAASKMITDVDAGADIFGFALCNRTVYRDVEFRTVFDAVDTLFFKENVYIV